MLFSELERFGRLLEPWRDLDRLNRTFAAAASNCYEFPAFNVWAGEEKAVITAELPGIDPASIDISVIGNSLTLKGSRKPEELKEGEAYHRRERWYGDFSKTIEMPFAIEADKVEARFIKGVLHITASRAAAEMPKRIEVKAA